MSRSGLLFACSIILAFVPGCGTGGVPATKVPPPPPPAFPQPTVLRTLYRVNVNGTDRMTSFGPNERNAYPLEAQLYYVADAQANGLTTLERLVSPAGTDHTDGLAPITGYSLDETLGYAWTAMSPGLAPILEAFNSTTGDHAMVAPSENLAGYVSQPLAAYAYPRFGNQGEVLLSLTAGGVTVQSNAVAGGSTWRWFWNGLEFINNSDYGRQIQNAFYPTNDQNVNPNEAGDLYARATPITAHGSPTIRFENQGNTQYTRAIPLNWVATTFGGDPDHPVIWDKMVMGKDLTLNFNNMGSVAQYTSHLIIPTATKGTYANPAGYLRSSFNRFWVYAANSQLLTEVTSQMPDGCTPESPGYVFTPAFGGIIMSDASGNNAMGIYGVESAQGGGVMSFVMWQFDCWGDGDAENASDNTAWSAVYGNGNDVTFPAGESTYNVYIITDTVQNVTAQMDRLYAVGVR